MQQLTALQDPNAGDCVHPPICNVTVNAATIENNDWSIELQVGPQQESEPVHANEDENISA